MITDALARPLRSLRLSVTDRCNLRCAYCMPEEDYVWLPNAEILSFEELDRVVGAFTALGVDRVRLTGGEPLVRKQLPELVRLLAARKLADLALTTNGVLLADQADPLRQAGLRRITVSIDTLHADRFKALTKREHHAQMLEGIAAAGGFPEGLKLDTVVMRGFNDDELIPLLEFAGRHGAELRFIEYMDVGGATRWTREQVVSRAELLAAIGKHYGPVKPLPSDDRAPAQRFALPDGRAFGIIASTTQPFCRACDRSRVTADGRWFTCLYAEDGLDLKGPLRRGEPLEPLLSAGWSKRSDRGAERRLELHAERAALKSAGEMRANPHLEMHTRGG